MTPTPDDPTVLPTMAETVATAVVSPPGRTNDLTPGAIVAGRYRLVALLGRGGMGEVYRADDLTLAQPVALKFLPAGEVESEARLSRFHNELRIARQVSHRNVCRVYDLGDANGRRFLTMEYVDGEDLSSLLRRIGRIAQDKAVEIARQLCAGVAAAHDRGVLHRDLKPANVMIDGVGNVRVTDFGIATAMNAAHEGFAGTPQYMAPEQIAGGAASQASDIYALGLVLFELFTGRRAVESRTLADLREFHSRGTITTPSSIVHDLDPAVERAILRCLERDPARRPMSALVVAAGLPGADPLAAALAAGETPSPALLAAAGETDALPARRGLAAVGVFLAGIVAFAALTQSTSIVGRVPLPEPPDVLVDRAEGVVSSLGFAPAFADRAYDFALDEGYLGWIQQTTRTPDRWDILSTARPSALHFWYRTSPRPMQPRGEVWVSREDPPPTASDMKTVLLDAEGRLLAFRWVPPQTDAAEEIAPPLAWEPLFAAAGLSMADFTATAPAWLPREYADLRVAWEGPLPDRPDLRMRVEGAAYRNRPVSFDVIAPWTEPVRETAAVPSIGDRVLEMISTAILLGLFGFAGIMARRNLREKRADRRGAARLGAYLLVAGFLSWVIGAHHLPGVNAMVESFFRSNGPTMLFAAIVVVVYVAVEPYVRRFWPDSLLGWSRLLAGHVRDPRVGRDALIGLVAGMALALCDVARALLLPWFGYPAPRPSYGLDVEQLSGGLWQAANWMSASMEDTMESLMTVLVIVILRLVLRRTWLVVPVTVLILSVSSMRLMGGTTSWIYVFPLIAGMVLTFVVLRYGLLPLVVTRLVWGLLLAAPMTLNVSHWSAVASNATMLLLASFALFAYYASRAGQPLLGAPVKE